MARAPVQPASSPIALRPVASPVDTFVAPGPSPLRDIAQALAPMDRGLNDFLDQRAAKQKEEDTLRGEAAFLQNNREGYAEGVKSGKIPAFASPFFVQAYKRAEGANLGTTLQAEYNAAYDAWEGKYSDDPNALGEFNDTFLRGRLDGQDPHVLAGALPVIRGMTQQGLARSIQDRHNNAIYAATGALGVGINQTVDGATEAGFARPEGTDYGAVFTDVVAKRSELIRNGLSPEVADKTLMGAMAAKVLEKRDPKLLDFFDQKVPGQDYTFGSTAEGQALRADTIAKLEVIQRQAVGEDYTRQTREAERQKDAAQSEAVSLLSQGLEVPEELLARGTQVDPTFRVRVKEWKETFSKSVATDPEVLMSIRRAITEGGGVKAVVDAADAGVITNLDDFVKLHTLAKGYEENKDRIGSLRGDNAYKSVMGTIDIMTKGNTKTGDPLSGLSMEGFEAQYDFETMMSDWIVQNPNATPAEISKQIAETGRLIMDRIERTQRLVDDNQGGIYKRPADAEFDNPFTGATEAKAPVLAPQPPTAEPKTAGPWFWQRWFGSDEAEAAPIDPANRPTDQEWYGSLSSGGKRLVQSWATRQGKTLEEAQRHFRNREDQKNGIAPVAPEGSPKPAARPTDQQWFEGLDETKRNAVQRYATLKGIPIEEAQKAARARQEGTPALKPEDDPYKPISYRADDYEPASTARPDLQFLQSRAIQGAERPDSFTGMRPEFASGVEQMIRGAPPEIASGLQVMSGYRSPKKQAELYQAALKKYGSAAEARKWVAPPGRSGHNHGHAADLAFNGVRLDKAPPHVKKWVHDNAAKYGLAFPLGNEAWHVELAGARSGGGGQRRRAFSADEAAQFIEASLVDNTYESDTGSREEGGAYVAGDPRAGRLLDFIKEHEAGGNYNAVFGNANSKVDLGQFTLDQVMAQQQSSGRRSTAIGGYQFMHRTLRDLKRELGLTGKERFTPDFQDRLGLALLERRGYREFKAGKRSLRNFAFSLSQEWSALPDPGTGRSFYHNDGLNRAQTSRGEVYEALRGGTI